MNTHQILVKARSLIAVQAELSAINIRGWIQRAIYKDRFGRLVHDVNRATCFCSAGAVLATLGCDSESSLLGLCSDGANSRAPKAVRNSYFRALRYIDGAAVTLRFSSCFSSYNKDPDGYKTVQANDNSSHADVLAMFDLAIKRAKRRHPKGG